MILDQRPGVVVVTHNHRSQIVRLAGIAGSGEGSWILVDTESVDGSVELAVGRIPQWRVVTVENRGFGAACNVGASLVGGDVIAFLNPDTEPVQGWLRELTKLLDQEPGIGIVCPETPEVLVENGRAAKRRKFVNTESAAGPGAALVIRRSLFEELAGFDERLFLYWEDTDLCWRAVLHGARVVHTNRATVFHRRGSSGGSRRWAAEQSRNGMYVVWSLLPLRRAMVVTLGLGLRAAARSAQARSLKPLRALLHPPGGWAVVRARRAEYGPARKQNGRHLAVLVARHRRELAMRRLRGLIRGRAWAFRRRAQGGVMGGKEC